MQPVQAHDVAAGEHCAVNVMGVPTEPALGPWTVQTGGLETTHVSVWGPGAAVRVKLSQLGSESVTEPAVAEDAPVKANAAAKVARRMRKDRVMVLVPVNKIALQSCGLMQLGKATIGRRCALTDN
jgi:hypothetical protein